MPPLRLICLKDSPVFRPTGLFFFLSVTKVCIMSDSCIISMVLKVRFLSVLLL